MNKKLTLVWWVYIVGGLTLMLFIVPAMLSAGDTLTVIGALLLLVAFGFVSWRLWVRRYLNFLKETFREL